VSQAADITIFDADLVPVGEDQLPVIEEARELVRKFNRIYGETLVEPKAKVGVYPRVLGLDGRKMSKSLNNAIYLSDTNEDIRQKIKVAVTDKSGAKNLMELLKAFSKDTDKINEFENAEEIRWSEFKPFLAEEIIKVLTPIREKRKYYEDNPEEVDRILKEGTAKAHERAKKTMQRIRKNMKLDYFTK
jgi:tryptophanyl-tRNA synthetase